MLSDLKGLLKISKKKTFFKIDHVLSKIVNGIKKVTISPE
jgi:hypothetical protein